MLRHVSLNKEISLISPGRIIFCQYNSELVKLFQVQKFNFSFDFLENETSNEKFLFPLFDLFSHVEVSCTILSYKNLSMFKYYFREPL